MLLKINFLNFYYKVVANLQLMSIIVVVIIIIINLFIKIDVRNFFNSYLTSFYIISLYS